MAKKDELLAAKDRRIDTLEYKVTVAKNATSVAPVFRARARYRVVTPTALHGDRNQSVASTPNQVSDDSGEVEPESQGSLSHRLSHISQAHSSDEDSTMEHTTSDGRWNIPFDGSVEDLTAKSPSGMGTVHGNALKEIDFIPISDEGRWCFSGGFRVTPVQPVASSYGASAFAHAAKKGLLKDKKRCIWLCLQVLED